MRSISDALDLAFQLREPRWINWAAPVRWTVTLAGPHGLDLCVLVSDVVALERFAQARPTS
jgi:hypothetical protein